LKLAAGAMRPRAWPDSVKLSRLGSLLSTKRSRGGHAVQGRRNRHAYVHALLEACTAAGPSVKMFSSKQLGYKNLAQNVEPIKGGWTSGILPDG
jgi:hypothetical protein